MKILASVCLWTAALVLPLLAGIAAPIKVEGGLVSGTPGWGWNVREFRGVPFAAPPVGNLRWRPPQPVVPWQGVSANYRVNVFGWFAHPDLTKESEHRSSGN